MAREMKDSGIEWIGEIPREWEVIKIKRLGEYRNGLTYMPSDITDQRNGMLVLRSSNIQHGKISLLDNVYVSSEISEQLKVKQGDIIICSRNGSRDLIGKCAIVENELNASFGAFMMKYRCEAPRYMYYILNSAIFKYYLSTFLTATINQLTGANFGNMAIVWCKNREEQIRIVDFLDTQCAHIDSVIEKTRAAIEEYKRLKQSVITQAVTKGIRPNREMKDSGLNVISSLPRDWKVNPIKHICEIPITDGTHMTPDYSDENNGSPFISSKDVTSGQINWTKIKYITKELHNELKKSIAPRRNDILLAKNGTTGVAALVDDDREFDVYVTIAVIRVKSQIIIPKFALYSINSQLCKRQFDEHLKGIGVPNLHLGTINNTKIFIPAISEQTEIVAYLDEKTASIDSLIQKKEQLITELEAYKKSLIYEYVTGKKEVVL